ncbi:MAG: phosphoglycerate dehydrogenase [Spirochaetales bacterium]|uniref:Phosphoglycerate dehydrogenase n=1 Tax=Candidatus Thalassospirochaeta sargassi TaxID=3119039 RepID=A0AAJ1IFG5_9SPIO|nr:phosphoglycerate dehydrogenase [Spirochaetales bacterium]
MEKILITPRSLSKNGHPALDDLRDAGYEVVFATPGKQPTEAELMEILPECVGYLAGVEPVSGAVLRKCEKLKVISRNGVGVDNVDLEAAEEKGIIVEKALGTNSRGVAELAITLMLSGIRSLPYSDKHIKACGWERRKGFEVEGKILGIIGCGQIGRYTAKMALGLDMKVIAYDLYPDANFKPSPAFSYADVEDIFAQADIISLHCPPGEKPLIDAAALDSMKDGVFIVNTARAGLIDEAAVVAALDSGKLFGMATDVFPKEPPEPSEMIAHEKVITTPHIGGFTNESVDRATQTAVNNILKVLND